MIDDFSSMGNSPPFSIVCCDGLCQECSFHKRGIGKLFTIWSLLGRRTFTEQIVSENVFYKLGRPLWMLKECYQKKVSDDAMTSAVVDDSLNPFLEWAQNYLKLFL